MFWYSKSVTETPEGRSCVRLMQPRDGEIEALGAPWMCSSMGSRN